MTALEVYLILQVDSLRVLLGTLSAVLITVSALVGVPLVVEGDVPDFIKRWWPRTVFIGAMSGVLVAVVPSSTTLAAMYILPRLTSPEAVATVAPEARELYELAKRGLYKLVGEK